MTKIRYGQIGVGHPHANKIKVYRSSEDYEVVGVVEPDPELRQAAQRGDTYRDVPFVTKQQLLNTPGLQVVGVETKVRDLMETAQDCVSAGMHVHLDKPGGVSLPQFRGRLDEAARRHLVIQMGYMYRYNPAIILLRQLLANGWLGDVFEVHTVMSKMGNAAMRRDLSEFSGGTMFELGCHLVDLVHGVLGAPDNVHSFPRHSSDDTDDLKDNILAVFEYPRATATVRTSITEVDGFARRHFVVCGTKGTAHIQPLDRPTMRLTFSEPHGKYVQGSQEIRFPGYSRYLADAADLAGIIRHEKDPDFSYEHDYEVLRSVLLAGNMPTT